MQIAFISGLFIHLHADSYPEVSVRLVGGLTAAEGRVEVNYGGTWGTVCNDSSWDLNDAMVICRMLGYSSVLAAHVKYGEGSGTVWMSNLACTGSESSISECPHIGWGETSCSHSQDAGVTCGGECCYAFRSLQNQAYILNALSRLRKHISVRAQFLSEWQMCKPDDFHQKHVIAHTCGF